MQKTADNNPDLCTFAHFFKALQKHTSTHATKKWDINMNNCVREQTFYFLLSDHSLGWMQQPPLWVFLPWHIKNCVQDAFLSDSLAILL